ncbi:mismatch-specific DNA-glycosylase [Candidatus Poseidoniales archaeon]|nr:mismatch-specific DNA-glycosylase [Candidatus Poseidoniales archaeon]
MASGAKFIHFGTLILFMGVYHAKLPGTSSPPCHTLFIGHNPSEHTWASGHYFSNPSNRFWTLLEESGLQFGKSPHLDDVLVNQHGFGFCDVIEVPGNNANDISRAEFLTNKGAFLHRVEKYAISMNGSLKRLCFVGKRQWKHLFTPILSRCPHGRLNQDIRPEGWPLTLSEVEVWIMPSPSGRAVIPHKERLATYIDLAEILADEGM